MQNNRKAKPPVPWENHAKSTALSDPKPWTESPTAGCIDNTLDRVFNRKNKLRFHLVSALLTISLMQLYGTTNAQRITINSSGSSIKQMFQQLEKQSGYSFFYKDVVLDKIKNRGIKLENGTLQQALDAILKPNGLEYEIVKKTVVIKTAQIDHFSLIVNQVQQQFITGKVLDEEGKPLAGATLRLKSDSRKAVQTQVNGIFNLPSSSEGETVIVSVLGFEKQEFVANKSNSNIVIKLKKLEQKVDEVVVTGMMTRKKESFSGATASFTGQELKMVNNQNVVAGLRALDPSFIQIENNALGSNPNMLPTIELRGQTSISTSALRDEFSIDPNQPLFILDGFETNLRTIMDLDMNIIQNVTILKDAASTAIYGSRASNGVIVVETIKPKAGKIMLSYTTDMQAQIPDLSSYNMMNAPEKLEFERLSGRYTAKSNLIEQQILLDSIYNARLQEVLSGVDTYWLKIPVQTGFSHRHSLSARGGEGALVFDAGVNYKNTKGSMKGSGRDDWSTNLNLNYRAGKLNIANRAFVTGYTGNESPYGGFATWANTNPYYRPLSAAEKFLTYKEDARTSNYSWNVFNPIYDANLSSFNTTKNYVINNNLMMTYDFNSALRLTASGQISKGMTNTDNFLSPLHSSFEGVENRKKGSLAHRESSTFGYTANAMLTYSKVLQDKHTITANLRGEISESQNRLNGYKAVGFPAASNGNPSFAFGFEQDSKPAASTRISRRTSILGSINYSYDQRFNFDINYNLDGSTSFGSNNLFSPYYSFGTSWNIHNERFAKTANWINMLRLRANIGITGNQNFGNVSQSIFDYNSDVNRFGQGIVLSALGAPDLEWQRTRQTSVGIDATLFNNKLNFQINAYDKFTDPLVVAVTLPSSTGLSAYPFNAGTLDYKGLEATINFSPIYRPQNQFIVTFGLTGSMLKAKYAHFDNKLSALNNEMKQSNALIRYRDGYSPNTLWAVQSQGIDPSSGREIFLTKAGEQTFNYNADDLVAVGNAQPLAEGILRGTLSYKGFTTNVLVRYILRKDNFNKALYDKVENMSEEEIVKNNQDKRALYDRWQNPGDIAQFRGISITDITPMSSRFIQRENSFSGESISFGYEFRNKTWLDRLNLSTVRINSILNDIFYSSTVRRERGIEYPFSRSVSFSLNATFK